MMVWQDAPSRLTKGQNTRDAPGGVAFFWLFSRGCKKNNQPPGLSRQRNSTCHRLKYIKNNIRLSRPRRRNVLPILCPAITSATALPQDDSIIQCNLRKMPNVHWIPYTPSLERHWCLKPRLRYFSGKNALYLAPIECCNSKFNPQLHWQLLV